MDNINAKKIRTRQEFKIKTNPKDKDYYVIVNDPIPFIYSNVRGYYLFRYITDKIGKKDNQS